jgi:hypothetical protein
MSQPQTQTTREILVRLANEIETLMAEQKKIVKQLKTVAGLLKVLSEDPDAEIGDDNFKLDEHLENADDKEPESVEVDNVIYSVGDKVVVYDSRRKRWLAEIWQLSAFCEKMAFMKRGGHETRRKYGNFRLHWADTE